MRENNQKVVALFSWIIFVAYLAKDALGVHDDLHIARSCLFHFVANKSTVYVFIAVEMPRLELYTSCIYTSSLRLNNDYDG